MPVFSLNRYDRVLYYCIVKNNRLLLPLKASHKKSPLGLLINLNEMSMIFTRYAFQFTLKK